jgi:nitrogen fixation NifU-like protein
MADLRELYQQVIVDHSKSPRNFRKLDSANRTAEGFNRLCGDQLTLYLEVEGGVVKAASFEGSGCAISTASASLMTETVKMKSIAEVEGLFQRFHELVTGQSADTEGLGKLAVLAGVREFPARVKCASLCWHTLKNALESGSGSGESKTASTE